MGNPYASKTPKVKKEVKDIDLVPKGSINEILDWVGEDQSRAEIALRSEESDSGHNRTTLIKKLQGLLNG